MAELSFEDISFEDKKDRIGLVFLRTFYAEIPKKELEEIGKFAVAKNSITFQDVPESRAAKKFYFLLSQAFKNLKNKITNKKTIYIHKDSGIPLIGHNAFGLIDRNTSIIEVRASTGCNLDCIYCSVDQNKRPVDFVVEKDYLIQEFRKLVDFKKISDVEAHLGTQGEPLLYEPLADLIKDLSEIPEVSVIALDTNGTLLTKRKVDELINAGLTRFCFSINALEPKLAEKIAGRLYDLNHILDILRYISKKDIQLMLTPVWIPGINDKEIPKLIELSKELKCSIGIQNFLNYRFGKNPVKQMSWDKFIEKMRVLEKKYSIKLLFDFKKDFNIRSTEHLPKPFRKGDVIKARIVSPGRLRNEMLAVAEDRVISVQNATALELNSQVKLKIVREKHNIYSAVLI